MKIEKLLLSHGGGGEETYFLIKNIILKYFSNSILDQLEDSAILIDS
ncbi:MAG: hydrogenase expression/formation protein HypE, partial [Thermodesulfobacterium geofontis]